MWLVYRPSASVLAGGRSATFPAAKRWLTYRSGQGLAPAAVAARAAVGPRLRLGV